MEQMGALRNVWLNRIKAVFRPRLFQALTIGAIAVIAQTAVFELLAVYWHILSPSTAVIVGAEFGILTNFFLNNKISFSDRIHATSLGQRLFNFHIVVSGSVAIQWLFVFIAEHMTANLLIIHAAYGAGIIVGFISNYIGYHLFVWKHPAPEKHPMV